MRRFINLQPDPRSAATARRWVRHQMLALGHSEAVDTAELATSEIVTNAILHAQTPITLALEVNDTLPRVLVTDRSASPVTTLRPPPGTWSSGRGLQILAAVTRRWGIVDTPPGKTVWFDPVPVREAGAVPEPTAARERDDLAPCDVVLLGAPVGLLLDARLRLRDLQRELMLIVMQPEAPVGVPLRLVELAHEVEAALPDPFDIGELEALRSAGVEYADMGFVVIRERGRAYASYAGLVDEAESYARAEHLLTPPAPILEAAVRRWCFHEVARQASGLPPRRWSGGSTAVEDVAG